MFIFDDHVHIGQVGPWYNTPEMLIDDMKRNGITKCYIQGGLPVTTKDISKNNDMVANAVKKYPEYFPYGIASTNPRLGDVAVKELERAFGQLGLKGVKLVVPYQSFHLASELTRPIYEVCEKYNVPVHMHTDWTDARTNPLACAEVASRFPKVTVIICHVPREVTNDVKSMACAQALRYKNVVLDTSAGLDSQIQILAKEVGPDRIVFGSDWPAFRYRFCKAKIEVCDLPEGVKAKIFGLNLAKMLGVDVA